MITSSEGFLIATPTKCATTTLEAVARRHMRQYPADADSFRIMDWDSPRRQHRMALPPAVHGEDIEAEFEGEEIIAPQQSAVEEWGYVHRYLFTRNPFTRYMSMYTYLSAPQNYSQWGARYIQGREWGGHDDRKVIDQPKMSFEEFLIWLAQEREMDEELNNRGDITTGRAYRSPWVWTDSLTTSLALLRSQPGVGEVEGLLRMERIWDALDMLDEWYGIGLDLSPIHANRSTAYGDSGAVPGSLGFWGGMRCTRRAFNGYKYTGRVRPTDARCGCGACRIGVAAEAEALGYVSGGDVAVFVP